MISTAAMTASMLQLYVLGALGPTLVGELRMPGWVLGALVGAGFAVAALLSIPAGALVDRLGTRRGLAAVFGLVGVALLVLASARVSLVALAAVLIGGIAQALANPATNAVIMATVPAPRRGTVTGWKQSGVQLGAFVAGLPLAGLAALASWRWGVAALGALSLATVPFALRLPAGAPASMPGAGPRTAAVLTDRRVLGLAVFSLALGGGLATVNTYLALFAHAAVGVGQVAAGALVAGLGVAGIVGRVGWSRVAGRMSDPDRLLPGLAVGAAFGATLLAASAISGGRPGLGSVAVALAWVGALLIGVFGVSANAVSMVAVMRAAPRAVAGRAAAVVSCGFFAGFAIGPAAGGALATRWGYGSTWVLVAGLLLAAGVVAIVTGRTPTGRTVAESWSESA